MTAIVNDITALSMSFSRGVNEADPVRLMLRIELSGNFDNLQSISVDLGPLNNPNWEGAYDGRQIWVTLPRIAGGGNVFEVTYDLSPYAAEADYTLRVVNLTDDNGNFINVTNTQLDGIGLQSSAHLTNPFADNLPPEISSIAIDPVVKLADGTFAIPVQMTLTDNKSGLIRDDVIIEFIGPYGANFQQRVSVDESGYVSTQVILPQYVASGSYALGTVRIYDNALNGTLYYHAEDHGGVGAVVLDNPDQDIAPPTLTNLQITGDFDPVNGRPLLHLVADIADEKAGVSAFWARTYVDGLLCNERGTGTDGHVEFNIGLLSPSATGVYSFELCANDNARNVQWWQSDLRDSQNGLGKLGFNGDILVFAPDESGYVGATVQGGTDDSIIFGLALDDTLIAGSSNDQLLGGAGADSLSGGGGADVLIGGDGNDTVNAGAGNDLIVGGNGAGDDAYKGGTGIDTVKYTSAVAGISVNLFAGTAGSVAAGDAAGIGSDTLSGIENVIAGNFADRLIGTDGVNRIEGMAGNDQINGRSGNDVLFGGTGNDALLGGGGADKLNGGLGIDNLRGGTGKDTMTGGLGADSFVFDDGEFGGNTLIDADVLKDFSHGQGDRISLVLVDANTLNGAADDAFAFIGTTAFGGVAGQLRCGLDANGNTFVQGDTNGDRAADFVILLTGAQSLVAADFVL